MVLLEFIREINICFKNNGIAERFLFEKPHYSFAAIRVNSKQKAVTILIVLLWFKNIN